MTFRLQSCCLVLVFGLTASSLFARVPRIRNTPNNQLADAVLHNLLSSPLGETMPRLHYKVALLAKILPNAFSNSRGHIYVTAGLFPALQGDRGVWAAVIGHELGHVLLDHPRRLPQFKARLRRDYLKSRGLGIGRGPDAWPAVPLGQSGSALKLSREVELQADFIGMMLMAEAGYQPGFSLVLDQRLQFGLGNTPDFVAMFSHHPRLSTREANAKRFYSTAWDIFHMRWPDAGKSPGGNLPPYGEIGHWTIRQEAGGSQLVFRVPFEIHNAEGTKVRIAGIFLDKNRRVGSTLAAYRASDGELAVNAFVPGTASQSGRVVLRVPASALATRDRHLTAVVFLMAGNRAVDLSRRRIDLATK